MIGSPPGFFITSLQFPQQKQQIRTHDQSAQGSDYLALANDSNFDRNPLRGCNYGLEGGAVLCRKERSAFVNQCVR